MSVENACPTIDAAELLEVAQRLMGLASDLLSEHRDPDDESGEDPTELTAVARATVRSRRRRDATFPGMFADAAWDILLDLFIAGEERRLINVSSACIAAAVPTSTALRVIGALERDGVIVRTRDPSDNRVHYLALADDARRKMAGLVREVRREMSLAIVRRD